ncbi:MAG: hypothetical protein ACI90V_011263 [Bacillariaceae sp.]|jgi:hypothetical protein
MIKLSYTTIITIIINILFRQQQTIFYYLFVHLLLACSKAFFDGPKILSHCMQGILRFLTEI